MGSDLDPESAGKTSVHVVQVMAQILGEQALPWEAAAEGSRELLRRLGGFRAAVLDLLARDPSSRLGITEFIARCRRVLERTTGTEGQD